MQARHRAGQVGSSELLGRRRLELRMRQVGADGPCVGHGEAELVGGLCHARVVDHGLVKAAFAGGMRGEALHALVTPEVPAQEHRDQPHGVVQETSLRILLQVHSAQSAQLVKLSG